MCYYLPAAEDGAEGLDSSGWFAELGGLGSADLRALFGSQDGCGGVYITFLGDIADMVKAMCVMSRMHICFCMSLQPVRSRVAVAYAASWLTVGRHSLAPGGLRCCIVWKRPA